MTIESIDHVQLAMPAGGESLAIAFYADILGLKQVPKPAVLAKRGGVWFRRGKVQLHLGVEKDFRPARKAHPALIVRDLPGFLNSLRSHGIEVREDHDLPGYQRAFVDDPFGNRIELMEPVGEASF